MEQSKQRVDSRVTREEETQERKEEAKESGQKEIKDP